MYVFMYICTLYMYIRIRMYVYICVCMYVHVVMCCVSSLCFSPSERYRAIHYFFVASSFLGFIFFDLLYIAVVINYSSQCQLITFYIENIRDKVQNKAYKSLNEACKVSVCLYLSVCLSVCPVCPFVCLSVRLFVCLCQCF